MDTAIYGWTADVITGLWHTSHAAPMLRLDHSISTEVQCIVSDFSTSREYSVQQSSGADVVADMSALSDGAYKLTLTAGAKGSSDEVEVVIGIVLDRASPSATFTQTASLLPKEAAASSPPALGITFADPAASDCTSGCATSPTRLECRMDHASEFGPCLGTPASWSNWTSSSTTDSTPTQRPGTLTLAAVLPGPHVFEIRAADLAGNVGPSSMWQWVALPADSSPEPAFAVLPPTHHDPPNGATISAFRPGGKVECTLDSGALPLSTNGAVGPGVNGEAVLANLAPGVHTLAAWSGTALASATVRWAAQTGTPIVTLQNPPGLGLAGYSRAAAWEVFLGSNIPIRNFVCRAGVTDFVGGWKRCCAVAYGAESICDTRCAIGSPWLAECGAEGEVWFANCLKDQGAADKPAAATAAAADSVAWSAWRTSTSPVAVLALLEELGAAGSRGALDGNTTILECAAVPVAERDPTAAGPTATASWVVLPAAPLNVSSEVEAQFAASEVAAAEACPETSKVLVAFIVIGWCVLVVLLLTAYCYREFLWAGWNPTQYRQKGLNVRTLEVTKEAPFQFVKTRASAGKTQQAESKGSSGDTPIRLGADDLTTSRPLHEKLSDPASEGYIDVQPEASPVPENKSPAGADWWDVDLTSAINDAVSQANVATAASPPRQRSMSPAQLVEAADAAEVNSFFATPTVAPRRHSLSPPAVDPIGAQDLKALEAQAKIERRKSLAGLTGTGFQVIKTRRASEMGPLKSAEAPEAQTFSVVRRRSPNASDSRGAPRKSALQKASPNKRSTWSP